MNGNLNLLALVKGPERYVFMYDDANRGEVLRMFGRFASNPDLSFTWYDAATLSQRVRRHVQDASCNRGSAEVTREYRSIDEARDYLDWRDNELRERLRRNRARAGRCGRRCGPLVVLAIVVIGAIAVGVAELILMAGLYGWLYRLFWGSP